MFDELVGPDYVLHGIAMKDFVALTVLEADQSQSTLSDEQKLEALRFVFGPVNRAHKPTSRSHAAST